MVILARGSSIALMFEGRRRQVVSPTNHQTGSSATHHDDETRVINGTSSWSKIAGPHISSSEMVPWTLNRRLGGYLKVSNLPIKFVRCERDITRDGIHFWENGPRRRSRLERLVQRDNVFGL